MTMFREFSDPGGLAARSRDPARVVMHADLIGQAEQVAIGLGIHRSAPAGEREARRDVLAAHQSGAISTTDAIALIARWSDEHPDRVTHALRSIWPVAHVEFHPSDVCNEACHGCTYGHDFPDFKPPPVAYPMGGLGVLGSMAPRAMTVVGGGEPLLYRDRATGARFGDLLADIRRRLPDCRFGLVSNGTIWPAGDWPASTDWVRVSMDAATPQTYEAFRGRPFFDRALDFVVKALRETPIPRVGLGFVFCRENISEAAGFAALAYRLVMSRCPDQMHRLNVQYRPLRRDPRDIGREDFPDPATPGDIESAHAELTRLARQDDGFRSFLVGNTNCEVIGLGNSHTPCEFKACGYNLIHRLFRANGEARPCCMRIHEPEFRLGNVLVDPPEAITLNALYNSAYLRPGCDGEGCKLGGLNRIIESVGIGQAAGGGDDPFFG